MSVYGDAFIESTGVSDIKSLATIAPDLNYAQVQTVVPVLTIRGISSRDTTEIGDPSVVVVTDGSSNNRPYALSRTLYDPTSRPSPPIRAPSPTRPRNRRASKTRSRARASRTNSPASN
ncbi:hypothetical protein [Caballeronia sp. GAOx1]|uniref:hypothetical protein n=1 Tax=Caballeronia sp. GAOx1 TaxID=2921761 RepID=UPI0020277693|nr:hypothetical protein [Caballeronia sp. GAOx1]